MIRQSGLFPLFCFGAENEWEKHSKFRQDRSLAEGGACPDGDGCRDSPAMRVSVPTELVGDGKAGVHAYGYKCVPVRE